MVSSLGNQPAAMAFQEPPDTIHFISIQKGFSGFGEGGLGAVCWEASMEIKHIFIINSFEGYDRDRNEYVPQTRHPICTFH